MQGLSSFRVEGRGGQFLILVARAEGTVPYFGQPGFSAEKTIGMLNGLTHVRVWIKWNLDRFSIEI